MPHEVRAAWEVERTYDVDADAVVPDLSGVAGVASVTAPETEHLSARYFDTADLRLLAGRTTLRHRTGGHDDGWHLKLPGEQAREELTVDAAGDGVPAEFAALVLARRRRESLDEVARLTTVRVLRRLLDGTGAVLAEVVDDAVRGHRTSDGTDQTWREWEVELVGADPALLDAVEAVLRAAGARTAASTSKAARVLGRTTGAPDGATHEEPDTAGAVVQAHVAEQVEELLRRDPEARRDLPDGVHRMRVATRRLRSALASFRPLLDREVTDPVRTELRWLAGVLGQVRDAEVVHARLTALVDAEPPELVVGQVRRQVDVEMRRRHGEALTHLRAELESDRYLALLDHLVQLAAGLPLGPRADQPAQRALAPVVRRTWRRLDRAMDRAAEEPSGPRADALLHEVRKDAKRARYAAQSLVGVFGSPARRTAKELGRLQRVLGQVQDGVAARAVLHEIALRAGKDGFTLGRLHALEQVRAEAARDTWRPARERLQRRSLRRWSTG